MILMTITILAIPAPVLGIHIIQHCKHLLGKFLLVLLTPSIILGKLDSIPPPREKLSNRLH